MGLMGPSERARVAALWCGSSFLQTSSNAFCDDLIPLSRVFAGRVSVFAQNPVFLPFLPVAVASQRAYGFGPRCVAAPSDSLMPPLSRKWMTAPDIRGNNGTPGQV